jgi:PKD repeat protein
MTAKPNLRKAILASLIFYSLYSSGQSVNNLNPESRDFRFIENKGQIKYQNGKPAEDVKYIYSAPGFKLILKENSFSYEVYTLEKTSSKENQDPLLKSLGENSPVASLLKSHAYTIHSSRIDISLPGANVHPQLIAEGERTGYSNYYNSSTINKGLAGIHSYRQITYKDIYPDIDFVFYADKAGKGALKYDIVVHPGGRLAAVKMAYSGTGDYNGIKLDPSKLFLSTPVGEIIETVPHSFIQESGESVNVWRQELQQNVISFNSAGSSINTLVIDPILTWGTYLGGTDDDEAYSMATDRLGNTYIVGYTYSSSDIATSGSFQDTYYGSSDAFLSKFNNSGVVQWSTYFGDIDDDAGFNVVTDTSGSVYISGYTKSTGLATTGAHQTTQGGGDDGFLAKFNSSGSLLWSTYYGDAGDDYGYGLAMDKNNYVFLSGYTTSDAGIATSGAHKTSLSAGDYDAYLVKFSSSGVRQWGTYCGGDDIDVGLLGLATDGAGSVYLSGLTYSTTGIATTGAYQTSCSSCASFAADAFIVKFNSSGVRQWGTYYGGAGDEYYYDMTTDASGNVIGTGFTMSTSKIASSGAHQTSLNGTEFDGFISKFNTSGGRQWGTYYGGSGADYFYAIATDASNNIYVAGATESTSGIATSKTHQTSNAGLTDAFLAKFSSTGVRQWGTYYGGTNDDYAYGISLDANLNVFISGSTNSTAGIATTGAHQTTQADSFYFDAFLAKFEPFKEDAGVVLVTGPGNGFCPGTQGVSVRVKNFGNIALDSVRVGWSVNGVSQTVYKRTGTFNAGDTTASFTIGSAAFKAGTNVLKVWTLKPNGVADVNTKNDTLKINIETAPLPVVKFTMPKTCLGDTVQFVNSSSITSGSISGYSWAFGDGGGSVSANPAHVYTAPGTYPIWLIATSDKGCKDSLKQIIVISPKPKVGFTSASSCAQGATAFTNISTLSSGSMTFTWDFGDGGTSTDKNPAHVYPSAGSYNVTLTAVSDSGCKSSITQSVNVTANPAPVVKFSAQDGCSATISFTNESSVATGSITSYEWDFGDSKTSTDKDPAHAFSAPGSYIVTLKATTNNGCSNTFSKTVTVFPAPVASFAATGKCAGSDIGLQNNSTVSDGNITGYVWSFGDGDSSTDKIPLHTYAAAGIYTITLIVTSDKGCTHQVLKVININPLPSSGFSYTAESRKLTFTADDGAQASYSWNFGDGGNAAVTNPVHTYAADGTYQITLEVTSAAGCKSSTTKSIVVKASGIAENHRGNSWKVYPNPVKEGYIIIEGPALSAKDISLYDVLGRKIPVLKEVSTDHLRLNLAQNTVPGIYYLRIENGATYRVVIE